MQRTKAIAAFACLIFLGTAEASAGRLTGLVKDLETGLPLIGANVIVQGTVLGAAADIQGRFIIPNLPAGTYTLLVTMMGYKSETRTGIRIESGEVEVNFLLKPTAILTQPLVVTASKRKQSIEDSPVAVDVLSSREIQSRSVATLDQVLENAPGIGIVDGQIKMRGSTGFNMAAGSRVLLMIDGHPHITGETGSINWDTVPVEEVEQVEIVKGAGSALYGSNAMAGMINIITRDPSPVPETRFKYSWGFYDQPLYPEWRWTDRFYTHKISEEGNFEPWNTLSLGSYELSHSRTTGPVGFLLHAGHKWSTGYTQNGEYKRWNVLGKTKIRVGQGKTWTVLGNWATSDHGEFLRWVSPDRPMEVPDEELGDHMTHTKYKLQSTFQHAVNQKLAYTLKANLYRNYWQHYFYDNDDYSNSYRIGGEGQVDYISGRHSLSLGAETVNYRTSSAIYANRSIWDLAFYAEDEFKLSPKLLMILGLRYDYHKVLDSFTDNQLSPRTGLVIKPAPGSVIRLSAGYGFRAPSIAEVFADITVSGFHVVPNLELREAERAWNFEVGWNQMLAFDFAGNSDDRFFSNPFAWAFRNFDPRFVLDLSLFWSEYTNMIDVQTNEDKDIQFMSIGRARILGAETRLRVSAFSDRLVASVGYTFLDPIDLNTGKMLNYRSKNAVNTSIELNLGPVSVAYDYRYASRVEQMLYILGSGFDEKVPMHVMDLRAIMTWRSHQFGLEVKNLANYNYTLRQKFLEPIRHYVFTWRVTI